MVERRLGKPDSLRERIYADLRVRLQRFEFGPDQRLVDVDVAATYGTSRMPVREALLRLVHDGYLVGTTRGFAVPRLTEEDVRDIFEVRRLIEPKAAANAARDLGLSQERDLADALSAARTAATASDLAIANGAFRAAWLSAVRNERLAATIARFVDQVQAVRTGTLERPQTRAVVIEGLAHLFAAFRRRDAAEAHARMTDFIDAAEAAYFAREPEAAGRPLLRAAG